jgi:hypothetical protein
MESSPSYQPYFERLIQFGSAEPRKADLLSAKAEYFRLTGEVFEDDKLFETRMAAFLDYYLLDRVSPLTQKSPARELHEQMLVSTPEDAAAFRSFTETVHGLFELRKSVKEHVKLRELFSGKEYDVTERRHLVGLEKGDIFEARLIPFGGHLWFSAAFCYHPREALKAIRKEIKRLKKKEADKLPREFAWECSKRALKAERYKQIPIERIYDFEKPSPL